MGKSRTNCISFTIGKINFRHEKVKPRELPVYFSQPSNIIIKLMYKSP